MRTRPRPVGGAASVHNSRSGRYFLSASTVRHTSPLQQRLLELIGEAKGSPIDLAYLRNGKEQHTTVVPVWSDVQGSQAWRIGAALESPVEIVKLPFREAVAESWRQNVQSAKLIYQFIQGIAMSGVKG